MNQRPPGKPPPPVFVALGALIALGATARLSSQPRLLPVAVPVMKLVEGADRTPRAGDKTGRDDDGVDREYKSAAIAQQSARTPSRMKRAEAHFSREQWAEGLSLLDEILAESTSPEYRRQRLREAARRRRKLEEKLQELEREANNDVLNNAPAPKKQGLDEIETDDERTPTVEVHSLDGVRFGTLPATLRDRLLGLPGEARKVYLRTYEAPAKNALEAALELPFTASYAPLRQVGERFPLTLSGRQSWRHLANRLADAGRFEEAAAALDTRLDLPFDDLEEDDEASARRPELLAQATMLHLFSGHEQAGRRYLNEISTTFSDTPVLVRGNAVLGVDVPDAPLFRTLLDYATSRSRPLSEWPTSFGSYGRAGVRITEDRRPAIGSEARWVYRLRDLPSSVGKSTSSTTHYRGSHPTLQVVTDDERLFLRHGRAIIALDAKTGKRVWRSDVAAPEAFAASGRFTPAAANSGNGSEDYSDLGGKALTLWRPRDKGHSDTNRRDTGRELVLVLDHQTRPRTTRGGRMEYQSNRLLALDAKSGKLVWKLGGASRKRDPTFGLAFTAPPTPSDDLLIVPAIRESGYYICGVDKNGKLLWLTRLYSFNPTYHQQYGTPAVLGAGLATADGVAYSAPGNGMVCAIESTTGRLKWMSRYRSGIRHQRSTGSFVHTLPILAQTDDGPCLLVAPADSDYLTALDARDGRILWEKRPGDSSISILGTDRHNIYLCGSKLTARSLRTGTEIWQSDLRADGHGYPRGHGFVAAGRLYVPRDGGRLLIVDIENGEVLEKLHVFDAKIPAGLSQNLFAIGGDLLVLGSWGIASIRPQAESWAHLRQDPSRRRFDQARLLRSEGKHEEALDRFYELLATARSKSLKRKLRAEILGSVRFMIQDLRDPAPIDRLLGFGRKNIPNAKIVLDASGEPLPPIVAKHSDYLDWRLRQAVLLWKTRPLAAVKLWAGLIDEDGQQAKSPESNTVDVRIYVSDLLREARFELDALSRRLAPPTKKDDDGDGNALTKETRQAIAAFLDERFASEDRQLGERVRGELDDIELSKIATRRSHSTRAAEATARLAIGAISSGDIQAAARHLRRLLADYPALRKVDSIGEKLAELQIPHEPEPRMRGLEDVDDAGASKGDNSKGDASESDASHGDALKDGGAATSELAKKDGESKASSTQDAGPSQSTVPWRQGFWLPIEEGILVSGARGADPLPVVLVLKGPTLRAIDINGNILMVRELVDFPDLEQIKTRLQSHIEEPATVHLLGRRMILFTAAGCYAFDIGAVSADKKKVPGSESTAIAPDAAAAPSVLDFDPRRFKLAWAQTYPHRLGSFTSQPGFGVRRITGLNSNVNQFPEVEFSPLGDPTLLQPNGEYSRIDRQTGKLLWRFRPEGNSVRGRPVRRGPWVDVLSTTPPGILRYRPPIPEAGVTKRSLFIAGPDKMRVASIVEGVANVFQGSRLEIRSSHTQRLLWKRSTSASLVHATAGEVWTSGANGLMARALRSGRTLRSIELPDRTRVDKRFAQPDVDGSGMTLVCSASGTSTTSPRFYYSSSTYQTGSKLWIVRIGADEKRLWASRLAAGPITYDGNRFVLDDGRWMFVFNAQDQKSEKWYTRIVVVDPQTGDATLWFEVEISGKGTGQPPRICPVAGGLAVGNAEGFGWFTTTLPPLEGEDAPAAKAESTETAPAGADTSGTRK